MTDVERVARAICVAFGDDPEREGPWATWWQQSPYATAACMAMRETRLIDAEALRAIAKDDDDLAFDDPSYYRAQGMDNAADRLEQRAGGNNE